MTTTLRRSAAVSDQSLEYLEQYCRRYVDEEKLAGTLTTIFCKGEVVYSGAVGMMDRERGKSIRDDTIFRIYSMSKPIASVALMQLYERGLMQIDDPVHRFIPSWQNLQVYYAGAYPDFLTKPCERPMTVRDLLSHQSGLTYGFMNRTPVDAAYRQLGMGREQCKTLQEMVDKLAELPLEFSPGTAWNYSHSTDVVGYLVEVISGEPLDRYLQEHIFAPLGMSDTAFWVRPDQVERFAANYTRTPSGNGLELFDDPQTSAYLQQPTYFSGGGGLVSTADDYMRFCRMLVGGGRPVGAQPTQGGARILGRKTLALMASNHITGGRTLAEARVTPLMNNGDAGRGFGLGFSVMVDPARAQLSGTPGEHDWSGAASTHFWIDPGEELAVVFMTQYMPGLGSIKNRLNLHRELRAIIYSALE